jgi:hypothetical protein
VPTQLVSSQPASFSSAASLRNRQSLKAGWAESLTGRLDWQLVGWIALFEDLANLNLNGVNLNHLFRFSKPSSNLTRFYGIEG